MKKIMWMLGICGLINYSAIAQNGISRYDGKNLNEGETLIIVEKIDTPQVNTPLKNNIVNNKTGEWKSEEQLANIKNTRTTVVHKSVTMHSSGYKRHITHKATAASHHAAMVTYHKTHKTQPKNVYYTTHISVMKESNYAGYRPLPVTPSTPPETENKLPVNSSEPRLEQHGNVKILYNSPYNSNNYPGNSNGGWDNGANGRGTNSQDGTIHVNETK